MGSISSGAFTTGIRAPLGDNAINYTRERYDQQSKMGKP